MILSFLIKIFHIKISLAVFEKANTKKLLELSEKKAIKAFYNAAKNLPYYSVILKRHNIKYNQIKSVLDFEKKVPITEKNDIFPVFEARDLCQHSDISDMSSAIVSSGTSGVFSYGILSNDDIQYQKKMVDTVLSYYFKLGKVRPLIINGLPMGVSFVSSYPVIPTSVRSDIILHVIRSFSPYFQKIIVITDPHVAKKIVEEGIEQNMDWKKIPISFAVGGTAHSNSYTQYMLSKIVSSDKKYNPTENSIVGTMGLTEVGLNVFTESLDLIRYRDIIQKNKQLKNKLWGEKQADCPAIMYYYPTNTFIEIINKDNDGFGDIVITNLDLKMKTPLIRYNTGDRGKLLNIDDFRSVLMEFGEKFEPRLALPLIAITGRTNEYANNSQIIINSDLVKEALYRDDTAASYITGHFKIKNDIDGVCVYVQAKKGKNNFEMITETIKQHLKELAERDVKVKIVAYESFGYDVDLNYEVKWKHL